jgi:hypothetical protein
MGGCRKKAGPKIGSFKTFVTNRHGNSYHTLVASPHGNVYGLWSYYDWVVLWVIYPSKDQLIYCGDLLENCILNLSCILQALTRDSSPNASASLYSTSLQVSYDDGGGERVAQPSVASNQGYPLLI